MAISPFRTSTNRYILNPMPTLPPAPAIPLPLSLSLNLIVRIGTATHLGHLVNFDLVHLDNGRSLLPLTRLCCTTLSPWCTLLGAPTRDGTRLCSITRRNQALSCSRCGFGCFTKTLLEGIDEWEAKEF